jgi:hypothetical protein
MKDINVIAKFPEVQGIVLSDRSGALTDSFGNVDGEGAGAVHSYAMRALARAGELLGIGTFQHASVTGRGMCCVIMLHGEEVVGVYVDPNKPLAVVEKKLEDALQKQ